MCGPPIGRVEGAAGKVVPEQKPCPQRLKPHSKRCGNRSAEALRHPKASATPVFSQVGSKGTRVDQQSETGQAPSLRKVRFYGLRTALKNFGDAHRVPFVVACCRWLVLLCFLLCFLFGCHGSILPFHSSWNFATVICCNCLNV